MMPPRRPNEVDVVVVVVTQSAGSIRKMMLDKKSDFILYWEYDAMSKSIQFEAIAKTDNTSNFWLGVGFSPSGSMAGADIVVCRMDGNGTGNLLVNNL